MNCPKCNAPLEADDVFCPECGAKLDAVPAPPPAPVPMEPPIPAAKPKGSRKKVAVFISIGALFLGIVGAIVLLLAGISWLGNGDARKVKGLSFDVAFIVMSKSGSGVTFGQALDAYCPGGTWKSTLVTGGTAVNYEGGKRNGEKYDIQWMKSGGGWYVYAIERNGSPLNGNDICNFFYNAENAAGTSGTPQLPKTTRLPSQQSPLVGTEIKFGSCGWVVLAVEGNTALVIAKDIIEERPYNSSLEEVTWGTCSLRAYLNGPFYDSFSDSEKARVIPTKLKNKKNPEHKTQGGKDTTDNVFLLSIEEAEQYFTNDKERIAYNNSGKPGYWWLRSPGGGKIIAATVLGSGEIGYAGSAVNYKNRGVRPAMWIELN